MLSADVARYIALRRTLGYKLEKAERHLHAYARFAAERDETHISTATALDWVEAATSTPGAKAPRWTHLVHFARFLHAEDPRHEIPPASLFRDRRHRPVPYIYSPDEIARILDAAGKLRRQRPNPLRRELYVTLFGLIASTGLRISEAIALRLDDVRPDGVLRIRETKFRKSRLVPLHPSAMTALDRYLELRRRLAGHSDHLFPSVQGCALAKTTITYTFGCLLRTAGIAEGRPRRPRVHDLRHTFATRALERCGVERGAVARHFVALSTYLGHADIRHTYWYLEATPELMADIAATVETSGGNEIR